MDYKTVIFPLAVRWFDFRSVLGTWNDIREVRTAVRATGLPR